MSAFMPTDFTKQARDTKIKLDKFFCIVVREEALRIIEDMRKTVQGGKYLEKLADIQMYHFTDEEAIEEAYELVKKSVMKKQ